MYTIGACVHFTGFYPVDRNLKCVRGTISLVHRLFKIFYSTNLYSNECMYHLSIRRLCYAGTSPVATDHGKLPHCLFASADVETFM